MNMTNDRIRSLLQLGIKNGQKGKFPEAIGFFEQILLIDGDNLDALSNIGTALEKMGENKNALEYYKQVVLINPNFPNAHYNLGVVHKKLLNFDLAIKEYKKEIENQPSHVDSHNNLANLFAQLNKKELAIKHYQKVLSLNPHHKNALYNYEWLLREICDWESLNKIEAQTHRLTLEDIENNTKPVEHPFSSLVKSTDNKFNLQIAKLWSNSYKKQTAHKTPFTYKPRTTKIKLGYLSGDFYDHPIAHLIGKVFSYHNREKFEVYVYSYTKPNESKYIRWLQESADHFVDLFELTDYDAAKKINQDQIDILVDLTGYTKNGRMGILSYKPALIQVSWLGFPGTTGAKFIDYIIADKTVLPPDEAAFYSEKPLYMPNCYQVAEGHHWEEPETLTKKTESLPENNIIFGSFNQSFKITQEVFNVWMNIIRRVPHSVLWLYTLDSLVQMNLKKQARLRNVDPERLIFARHVSKSKHLARLSLCDLMLDTYPYNGHTTTTDALWAGVPVVTLKGKHFASRVAESILKTIGMQKLVTETLDDYEKLAIEYSREIKNRGIKDEIRQAKQNSSVFKGEQFVRDFEDILQNISI